MFDGPHGGPHGPGPGFFGGPGGPGGPGFFGGPGPYPGPAPHGPMPPRPFHEPRTPGAYGRGSSSVAMAEEAKNFKESLAYGKKKFQGQKLSSLKGFFVGTAGYFSQPLADINYQSKIDMTQRAYDEGRITKEQYDYRMIKAHNKMLWRKYKLGIISGQQYEESIADLQRKYEVNEVTRTR